MVWPPDFDYLVIIRVGRFETQTSALLVTNGWRRFMSIDLDFDSLNRLVRHSIYSN